MKLTTNTHSITEVKTTWDGEKNCVITNLVIEATVFGEDAAKTANTLKSGGSWLTLSSAPVRAVKKDTPKKARRKQPRTLSEAVTQAAAVEGITVKVVDLAPVSTETRKRPGRKPKATPAQPQSQGSDSTDSSKPIFDLRKDKGEG